MLLHSFFMAKVRVRGKAITNLPVGPFCNKGTGPYEYTISLMPFMYILCKSVHAFQT